jgi:sulfate adenylyltransferase subunit 2
MLHLARKAFYPGTLPFPLLHVDTGWKFREMYEFRDRTAKAYGCELLVHKNPEGVAIYWPATAMRMPGMPRRCGRNG